WVHRARQRWEARGDVTDAEVLEWRFFNEMTGLIRLRKQLPALRNGNMEVIDTANIHVFGFIREFENQKLLIVNNFSETPQSIAQQQLNAVTSAIRFTDRITGKTISNGNGLTLEGYQFAWLDCS
ncbi:MAG: alpha-glucosidase C-terminal domain-containing protein, partial [Desulfobacterales bacterium]|nr:alpha-glucosidase C-terminal domain-containing protein [Desulfobacterales bacterium]